MKHILLFPTWIIASIFLTLIVLILSAIRREWDREILPEIWDYKDFVRVSTNKSQYKSARKVKRDIRKNLKK